MHKLIQSAIFAAIGILVLASVLIPVLNDGQAEIDNIKYNGGNEYCVRMNHGAPDQDLYFTKPANEMFIECRKGSMDAEPYYIAPLNSVGQMGWIFLSNAYSLGITGYGAEPLDSTSKYNNQAASGYNSVADTKTVKINATTGKVITWNTDPNNTWGYYDTVDLDNCFWADPNGEYINVQVGRYPVWIENQDAIAGSSQTQGNYIFYDSADNVTVTSTYPATVSTETTEYHGLYSLTRVPMEITGADSSINNVTSAHVVVKYRVQGEPIIENSDAVNSVLSIMPLILIFGLILGVLGVAVYQRIE